MKLTEMKRLLAARGIRLTKSLGQNFLHDANQLQRIVAAAELSKSDRVLEIGPGLGPLTELLLAQAGEVLAIEKDAKLAVLKTFELMAEALRSNEKVVISNFGTFKVKDRMPRQARNPKTNQKVMVGPRKSIRFKPSKNLTGPA